MKIFKIPVDVRDMPASSKTFLRQRTYCMPKGLPIEEATKTWLRYLTHFRFVTDRHGRLYLHTDIRCLFSNKSDLDVQNLASGQEFHLVSHTQFPQEPKYSTIQWIYAGVKYGSPTGFSRISSRITSHFRGSPIKHGVWKKNEVFAFKQSSKVTQ